MPYSAEGKRLAKEHVAALRIATACARCGKPSADWHHIVPRQNDPHHNRAVSRLAGLGYPLSRIDAEIALCEALCRSCHMALDGRSAVLTTSRPYKKGDVRVGPLPCLDCGALTKPTRRGRCGRCRRCYGADRRNK